MIYTFNHYAQSLPFFCQPQAPDKMGDAESEGAKASGAPKSFKERFCVNWRVIPALLSLVACIIGLVLSIVWNYQYLSVAFGLGIGGALYMLYLAYQSRLWQSLETSTKKFIAENQVYAQENIKLRTQVETLNQTSADLSETRTQLNGEVSNLSKTVTSLKEEKEQLNKIAQECKEAVEFQQRLKEELTKLEEGLKGEKANISETFGTISLEVKTLAEHNATTSTIHEDLQRTGNALSQIFSQVSAMVDSEEVKKRIEQQALLGKQLEDTNNKLLENIKELSRLEAQIKSLQTQADQLEKHNKTLEQTNLKLTAQVEQFTTQNSELSGSIESIRTIVKSSTLDGAQVAEIQKEKERRKKEEEDKKRNS